MKSRRTRIKVIYQGRDISDSIIPYVKSFTYTEAISDEADSSTITLIDRDELWIGDWFPEKGSTLTITIIKMDNETEEELNLGKFEIDEIENTLKPSEAKIKLVSIPNSSEIRNVEKSRSWEKVQLSKIANDIANESNLELFYDTSEDPIIERAEQDEISDISFLKRQCLDSGLALKVTDSQLIIFDVEDYEKKESILTLEKNSGTIKDFRLSTTIHEIYKSCRVKYAHGQKNNSFDYTFTDSEKDEGMTLQINQKVESTAEAEKLAKKKLREKNREETKANFTLLGDFRYLSGNTIEISGFHVYDGKYIITKTTHELSNGYTTKIELKRCLKGY